jgi:hypothetical protein
MPEGGTTGRPMPTQEDYQAEVWKIFDHIDKVQADITEGTFWPEPERGSPLATDNRRTAPLHMGHSLQTLIVSGMIQERVAGEKSPAFENRKQWIDELITRHRITDLPWRFEISEVIKAVDAAIDATTHYEAYWRTASAFAHGRQWTQLICRSFCQEGSQISPGPPIGAVVRLSCGSGQGGAPAAAQWRGGTTLITTSGSR